MGVIGMLKITDAEREKNFFQKYMGKTVDLVYVEEIGKGTKEFRDVKVASVEDNGVNLVLADGSRTFMPYEAIDAIAEKRQSA